MNKKQRAKTHAWMLATMTAALGPPDDRRDFCHEWSAVPRRDGLTVRVRLWDVDVALDATSRLNTPADWYDDDGYTKPLRDLPAWPGQFTYPSGKNNCHYPADLPHWLEDLVR